MIGLFFLTLFTLFSDGINSQVASSGANFQFSQNANLLAVFSYMMQSNHFFPMDTYLAIAALYFIVYGLAGAVKVVEVVLNIVRGAGLRL